MDRTITVKGQAQLSAQPDYVEISMTLQSLNENYGLAMEGAAEQVQLLKKSLTEAGFAQEDIKTASFQVSSEYESVRDNQDNWKEVFKGFLVRQDLKLSFDFNQERLAQAIAAVAKSSIEPRLSIAFTLRDPSDIKDKLLELASETALRKARVLAKASGLKLGQLLSINYSWGDPKLYSTSDLNVNEGLPMMVMRSQAVFDSFEPEEIKISDSVSFVWELTQ